MGADRSRSAGGALGRSSDAVIRVVLPQHLQRLASVDSEVTVQVAEPVTQGAVLDALEAAFPVLCGTIRDHVTRRRRPFVRFFACEEDVSHAASDTPLPAPIAEGREPFLIVGALAGG